MGYFIILQGVFYIIQGVSHYYPKLWPGAPDASINPKASSLFSIYLFNGLSDNHHFALASTFDRLFFVPTLFTLYLGAITASIPTPLALYYCSVDTILSVLTLFLYYKHYDNDSFFVTSSDGLAIFFFVLNFGAVAYYAYLSKQKNDRKGIKTSQFYSYSVEDIDGKLIPMSDFQGKVLLILNTARF